MADEYYHPGEDQLAPLVASWVDKIKRSRDCEDRLRFDRVAKHCRCFTRSSKEFWKDGGIYTNYMDADVRPRFKMTFAKVFELVAQFGPMLFHRNPHRQCKSRKGIDPVPQLLQPPPPGMPPEQAQQFQQQQQQQIQVQVDQFRSSNESIAQVTEYVLNYLPDEQPGGGLYKHARRAITEALITGRGCLWTEIYANPDGTGNLVQSIYDTVDNLLIDPDATKPDLSDAWWIAKKCEGPVWEIEQMYGLPPGKLKGHYESTEQKSQNDPNTSKHDRREGETNDVIVYYKIWSKTGIGYRHQTRTHAGHKTEAIQALDHLAGNYVHLVIAPGCPYPLNLPGEFMDSMEATEDAIRDRLKWPVEHWRDNAWPVSVLDFYENENSAWPMAPMQPALGEIVFINVMLSALANRSYEASKDLIGVLQENLEEVERALDSDKPFRIFGLTDSGNSRNLNDIVQVFQNRSVNFDAWRIIEAMLESIERRTGLTDLVYGQSTTQSRSAEDAAGKQQQMQIRPDDMAAVVENWQQCVARNERLTLHSWITGQDLQFVLGAYGAYVWDNFIKRIPVEVVLRGSDITIEAGSIRKPNRATEISNLERVTPLVMPVLQGYAQVTTDTRPLMWFLNRIADSLELDITGLQLGPMMPPPPPPPPPEMMQQQQQAQQAEQQQQSQQMQMQMMENQMRTAQLQQEHAIKTQQLEQQAQMQQINAQLEMQQAQARMAESAQSAEIDRQEFLRRMAMLQIQGQAGGPAI